MAVGDLGALVGGTIRGFRLRPEYWNYVPQSLKGRAQPDQRAGMFAGRPRCRSAGRLSSCSSTTRRRRGRWPPWGSMDAGVRASQSCAADNRRDATQVSGEQVPIEASGRVSIEVHVKREHLQTI
jgi:hypothetical protein